MSCEIAVSAENLSKVYPIFNRPFDRLKQLIAGSRRKYYQEFTALHDVSLQIEKGVTFGLLGQNGSGKSTILQILAGILQPSSGTSSVKGKVAALLELGAGFNPEFTGRENVFLNAALLGFDEEGIKEIFPTIEAFADIGEFIDRPVKTYSSGMFARLAFAVASSVSPDVLIVDEILSVGDAKFQSRCFKRLKELQNAGTTIILVTHSVEQVVAHCSKAAVLDKGRLVFVGDPRQAANKYLDLLFGTDSSREKNEAVAESKLIGSSFSNDKEDRDSFDLDLSDQLESRPFYNKYEHRWGDRLATILDVRFFTDDQETYRPLKSYDAFTIVAKIYFHSDIIRPIFGFSLKTKEGVTIFGSNSELYGKEELLEDAKAGAVVEVSFAVDIKLAPGDYFVSLGVASAKSGEVVPHDRRYDVIHIQVVDKPDFYGSTAFPFQMQRSLLGYVPYLKEKAKKAADV